MNRDTFFNSALESRVEAIIRLNHKPVSATGLIVCLELVDEEVNPIPEILQDLELAGTIYKAKHGYTAKEPLPSLAVARVSGIKKEGPRRYEGVSLTLENDPDFPFPLKISRSNAQKSKLVNGELVLVALSRTNGNELNARVIDRYRRTKAPVLPVKFTASALSKGVVAEVMDNRAKGTFLPVIQLPEDPKKHAEWNVEIPRTTSIFDTSAVLKDERFEHTTGSRVIDVLANRYGLVPRVTGEVKDLSRTAARKKLDLTGYRDLTHLPALVIDPPGAFDHDDAIYVEYDPYTNGFRTFVMNADVCARIPPVSMMFEAALQRGPTHFFPHDRKAFHMLHKDIVRAASLYEGYLKPVDYVETLWDEDLNPVHEQHGLAVIRSHRQLTYGQMEDKMILGQESGIFAYSEFFERAIEQKRSEAGRIMFTNPQDYLTPSSAFLVAFLMTYANETRAHHAEQNNLPFIFRVHGFCTNELAFARAHKELDERGYALPKSHLDLNDESIKDILEQANIRGELSEIEIIIRRNLLERARYSHNGGYHYGEKKDRFSHTTSPVRRPSDLYNQAARHRLLHPYHEYSSTALTDEWGQRDEEVAKLCNSHELRNEAVENDYTHFHDFRRLAELTGSTIKCHVVSTTLDELEIVYPRMGIHKKIPHSELPKSFLEGGFIKPIPPDEKIYVRVENVDPTSVSWDVSVLKLSDYPNRHLDGPAGMDLIA